MISDASSRREDLNEGRRNQNVENRTKHQRGVRGRRLFEVEEGRLENEIASKGEASVARPV